MLSPIVLPSLPFHWQQDKPMANDCKHKIMAKPLRSIGFLFKPILFPE